MIITLTMHPCIDKSTSVEELKAESKMRCSKLINEPGGGGINVAKALQELGEDPLAIFPAGGNNGKMLVELVKEEKVRSVHVPVSVETRESFMVLENSTNKQFRFVTPGAELSEKEVENCLKILKSEGKGAEFIVGSGSLAPGMDPGFYARLAKVCKDLGAKFILDTSGEPLKMAIEESVYLLKPNIGELAKLIGVEHLELDNVASAAREIIMRGRCKVITVSLGNLGAMLVTEDMHELVKSPEVEKKSTVGAGDSMVAGMVYMLSKKKSIEQVLRFGVACGTAATINEGSKLFLRQDVYKLYEEIQKTDD